MRRGLTANSKLHFNDFSAFSVAVVVLLSDVVAKISFRCGNWVFRNWGSEFRLVVRKITARITSHCSVGEMNGKSL